jgi:hypothetical protein
MGSLFTKQSNVTQTKSHKREKKKNRFKSSKVFPISISENSIQPSHSLQPYLQPQLQSPLQSPLQSSLATIKEELTDNERPVSRRQTRRLTPFYYS